MARILILGGGFGALIAAENLALSVGGHHDITLVAPTRSFIFYPALVQVAFGRCTASDVSFDLPARLRDLGVRFIQGEVLDLDPARRKIGVAGPDLRGELEYDYLLIAMGRRLATERALGFFEHSHHLLGLRAAERFGRAIDAFETGQIVVGACPGSRLPVAVCETAFALAQKFEGNDAVKIKVIFPESLSDAFGGASLHKQLESAFAKHGISVLYDVPITEITATDVISDRGHQIHHDLLMLVPPFRGHAIFGHVGIGDADDFVEVDAKMRISGMKGAYAAGDVVAFSGPKFGHMAVRQAEVAAANLAAEVAGSDPTQEYYHEIAAIIDAGGPDSIYLHYGIWDDVLYRVRQGRFWRWLKEAHDAVWLAKHE